MKNYSLKGALAFAEVSPWLAIIYYLLSKWVTDPECRQYILRQAYEESLHNWTVVTCCDSYSLKVSEVYEAYCNIPSIKAKDDFLMEITTDVNRNDFTTKSTEGKKSSKKLSILLYRLRGNLLFQRFRYAISTRQTKQALVYPIKLGIPSETKAYISSLELI